jgi:tetratricopeptide (TPR) repeat protein
MPFLVLLLAIITTGWAHSQVPLTTRADLGEDFTPRPGLVRAMAFGFDAVLADYYWLQAVQVAGGGDAIDVSDARQLGRLVDVVTTLNPHVGHPYRFAAVWLTHDVPQVRQGNRLLERAIEYHPDDWRNYFYLGFNHFFYLGDYEAAARVLEIAIDLSGRPAYLPLLVARLKSQHSDIEVAEVFLRELYRESEDEDARAKLQVALDEIEIEHKARFLDRARQTFHELTGRDIESVDDLTRGRHGVLEGLPSPEPDAIPASLARESVWEIDPETDRIVSSYLGRRYEVHFSGTDRLRVDEWQEDRASVEDENRGESRRDG